MLYTLNLQCCFCQLYLKKTWKKNKGAGKPSFKELNLQEIHELGQPPSPSILPPPYSQIPNS